MDFSTAASVPKISILGFLSRLKKDVVLMDTSIDIGGRTVYLLNCQNQTEYAIFCRILSPLKWAQEHDCTNNISGNIEKLIQNNYVNPSGIFRHLLIAFSVSLMFLL
jgi:hypothetical protein